MSEDILTLRWPTVKELRPTQKDFLECDRKFPFYIGPYGSGKTLVGAEAVYWMLIRYPGIIGVVGRLKEKDFRKTTERTLWEVIPEEFIDRSRSQPSEGRYVFLNDSELLFAHYDKPEQFFSGEYGFFWIDEGTELPDDRVFNAMDARLRQRLPDGTYPPFRGFLTGNPNGHDWVWAKSHPDSPNRGSDYQLFTPEPFENEKNLPDGYYEGLMRNNGADWVKRFVIGSFDVFERQIWKEWDPRIHVVPFFPVPRSWPRTFALDEGTAAPTAGAWSARDPWGNCIFYRDYCEISPAITFHAEAILTKSANEDIAFWYADPAIWQTRTERGGSANTMTYTAYDEYADAGIQFLPAHNALSAGISRVGAYLRPDPRRLFPPWHPKAGQSGAPRMYVMDRCAHIRKFVPQWRWKETPDGVSEQPTDKNKHIPDVVRYTIMTRDDAEAEVRRKAKRPNPPLSLGMQRRILSNYWASSPSRIHRQIAEQARDEAAQSMGEDFY